MRTAIARVYASPGWKKKVENMDESQVMAVYLKFEGQGKLWKKPIPQWKLKEDKYSYCRRNNRRKNGERN